MTDPELRQLADSLAQVLRPHLERSEALRRTISLLGQWMSEEAARAAASAEARTGHAAPGPSSAGRRTAAPSPAGTDVHAAGSSTESPASSATPTRPSLPMSYGKVPLKLGDSVVHLPLPGTTEELGRARRAAAEPAPQPQKPTHDAWEHAEVDLALVETRCRLKADSCRLFIEKRAAASDPDAEYDVRRRMNDMLAKGKAMPNCFLWVFWRDRPAPDDAALDRIAVNYLAHAEAAALVRRLDESKGSERSDDLVSAFYVLAEANSALRAALGDTWLTDDHDQVEIHAWLRQETAARRIFIDRHMTAGDPADPSNAADLLARIRQAAARFDERSEKTKAIKNALNQIRYHAGQVVKNGPNGSEEHWGKIGDAVGKLASIGVPGADRRIAEAVAPAAALWPAERPDPHGLSPVIERAKALASDAPDDEDDDPSPTERAWSQTVLDARALLRGRRIVIIGGERRGPAVERLTDAFELADVEWVSLTEHGSGAAMRAPIHRPDTAAVIVILKLSGHLHADEAREFANSAGKPCVLVSGGYNPERLAKEILDQASARLKR